MKPSLGRIVIFKLTEEMKHKLTHSAYDGGKYESCKNERAAIITSCDSNKEDAPVNLYILDQGGYFQNNFTASNVMQGTEAGQWHEPPRV